VTSRGLTALLLVALTAAGLASVAAAQPAKKHKPKLEGCVITTNNGSTTTEGVKVVEAGAGGTKGVVLFNGNGLKLTKPFKLAPNGVAVTPFIATMFGKATITVTLSTNPPQTYTFHFTLLAATDINMKDCTATN
jgi:hypothetical protein